jgi:hypothetical protein
MELTGYPLRGAKPRTRVVRLSDGLGVMILDSRVQFGPKGGYRVYDGEDK